MPDINIQQATVGRWRRSTKWTWAFVAGLAAVLTWGAVEMVQSARTTEHEVGPASPATAQVAEPQQPQQQATTPTTAEESRSTAAESTAATAVEQPPSND